MNKIVSSIFIAIYIFIGSFSLVPQKAFAAVDPACDGSVSFFGFPTWYKYLDVGRQGVDPCAITGPKTNGNFDWEQALPRVGLAIVEILLRISGLVAVGYIIYGGFRYITSQGDPESAKKAQGTVINALIGLAIAIMSTVFVGYIGRTIWS